MKKWTVALAALMITLPLCGYGNGGFVETHTKFLQVGVGYDLHGRFYDVQVPPLHIAFDYCVRVAPRAPLSFGVVFAYARSVEHGFDAHYDFFAVGARAAYHFTDFIKVDRLDLYAGIVLGGVGVSGHEHAVFGWYGWNKVHRFFMGSNGHHDDGYFLGGVYGGVRYFFTKNVGVFSELGYGISYINGGICFTF